MDTRSRLFATLLVSVVTGCSAFGGAPNVDPGGPEVASEDAGTGTIDAGAGDECGNGFDDDGDDRVDEGCVCAAGEQQRCFLGDRATAGVGQCVFGTQDCMVDMEFGRWNDCTGYGHPGEEECDGVDNNCNGVVDEGCECLEDEERACYTGPEGTEDVGLCRAGREYCVITDSGSEWSDCMDEVTPSDELCDGEADDDCDGLIDEGCHCTLGDTRECYGGSAETRNVGACQSGTQVCGGEPSDARWGECEGQITPVAEVCTSLDDLDCDGLVGCEDPDCTGHESCCSPWSETVPVVPPEAEIMFVVDRSGSMQWPAMGSSRSRWDGLVGAMTSILPLTTDLHMGLLTFPQQVGGDERLNCRVSDTPDIGLSFATGSAIAARLGAANPEAGDTPTPNAFATVRAHLASVPSHRPRFVVLLTDGLPEPNCGSTVPATVSAIEALRRDMGVETFVLGIVGPDRGGDPSGIPALRDGLNQMAVAGGRPRTGAIQYYEAVDGPALDRSLRQILAAATDCRFDLAAVPARPSSVEVRQSGTLVPASGYVLRGRRLEMLGSWCEQIQAGAVTSIELGDSCAD